MRTEFKLLELFGGIGGGDLGMSGARGEFAGKVGHFRTLCSIDADPVACRNFENITGNKAVMMDLFSRQQYIDFHGKEPPADWREATADELLDACGGEYPDVVFTSPPCKGFSGLLPEKSAKSKKYQALNQLTIRGIKLCMEAFADDLPSLFLLENVPRIQTRGIKILEEIEAVLKKAGYAVNRNTHDCGELGGLGQIRKRFLLIARNEKKMSNFVYLPPKKPLKTIGDVIGPLPMPGDLLAGGPMHRLPNLEWKTWVRLALIRAGGDWRDLNKVDWENYRIIHEPRRGAFEVASWAEPSRAVTSTAGPGRSNGVSAVSDPRLGMAIGNGRSRTNCYNVQDWENASTCVTGGAAPSQGATCISDPRLDINGDGKNNLYRVQNHDEPAACVTGAVGPSNGAACINDPRLKEREGRHPGVYRIVRVDEPAPCVTGTRFGSGAIAIADPNFTKEIPKFNHSYRITSIDETAGTVTSGSGPSNGAHVIADPRVQTELHPDCYGVQDWNTASKTVRSASRIMQSASCIADPRLNDREGKRRSNGYPVRQWDGQAFTITGEDSLGSGGQSISDPRIPERPGRYPNKWGVQAWDEAAATVTGSTDIQSGAPSIGDPRMSCAPRSGTMGVMQWDEPAKTVIGSGDIHAGAAAVADPRIPDDTDRGVWVIVAEDGTWHRPLTTYELAMLQGFPRYLRDGRPFQLEGCSDAKAREYIGNAVPPDAAQAAGSFMLTALMMNEAGVGFVLSWDEIWVKEEDQKEELVVIH